MFKKLFEWFALWILRRTSGYKLLPEITSTSNNNDLLLGPYRSQINASEPQQIEEHKHNTFDVIVSEDVKCPAYPSSHGSDYVEQKQCSPNRRLFVKKTFFRRIVCPIKGLHIHRKCTRCQCQWITPVKVDIRSYEFD